MRRRAPPVDPAQQELARTQAVAATEQIGLQREMWQKSLSLAEKDSERSEEQYQFNKGLQTEAAERDRFFFDRYQNTTKKQEDKFFEAVDAYDTEDNRRNLANKGMADVQAGMGRARQESMDMMRRRGVNVGSARAMGAMAGMDLGQAGAEASAFNMASEAARREGMSMRATAAGMGNALGQSSQYMQASSGFGGNAMDMSSRGLNWASGQAGQAGQMAQGYGRNANAAFDSVWQQEARRRATGFDLGKAISQGAAGFAKSGGNPWAAGFSALSGGLGG